MILPMPPATPCRTGMAIRAHRGLAGDDKACHVEGMAHTVARTAVPQAKFLAGAAHKEVIIGMLKIGLQLCCRRLVYRRRRGRRDMPCRHRILTADGDRSIR